MAPGQEPDEPVCLHDQGWKRYVLIDAWDLDKSLSDRKVYSGSVETDPPATWYVGHECIVCGAQGYATPD